MPVKSPRLLLLTNEYIGALKRELLFETAEKSHAQVFLLHDLCTLLKLPFKRFQRALNFSHQEFLFRNENSSSV